MGFKYIMLEIDDNNIQRQIPIIFPDVLVHEDVSKAISSLILGKEYSPKVRTVSAGDITISVSSVSGESYTLKAKSREEDKVTINGYPYFHGL